MPRAGGHCTSGFISQVAELAIAHRLPAIAAFKVFPQAGLLMSYGPDVYRRGAGYVDKI